MLTLKHASVYYVGFYIFPFKSLEIAKLNAYLSIFTVPVSSTIGETCRFHGYNNIAFIVFLLIFLMFMGFDSFWFNDDVQHVSFKVSTVPGMSTNFNVAFEIH